MLKFSILVLATVLLAPVAFAEKRVALVLGNSNYRAAGILANPGNDASDIAQALKRLQFSVTELHDLGVRDFDEALENFEQTATGADIALFFYAGHALTIDKRGYLIPVDFSATSTGAALRELVAVETVIAKIEHAAKASVVIFDACRDSPIAERFRRVQASQTRSMPQVGLAPIRPDVLGSNTLVVFATAFGEVAEDGKGRNSPFTSALLRHVATPGLEIQSVFTRVTKDVLRETGGKQQPERVSRLQTELIFLGNGQELSKAWNGQEQPKLKFAPEPELKPEPEYKPKLLSALVDERNQLHSEFSLSPPVAVIVMYPSLLPVLKEKTVIDLGITRSGREENMLLRELDLYVEDSRLILSSQAGERDGGKHWFIGPVSSAYASENCKQMKKEGAGSRQQPSLTLFVQRCHVISVRKDGIVMPVLLDDR